MDLSKLRKEYKLRTLDLADLASDPADQFHLWFKEALTAETVEPSAMQLSTVGKGNKPSCRTVLLKAFDEKGFRFFTNYESRKGLEIEGNPHVCLLICWKDLERQVTIEGKAEKTPREVSEAYFEHRSRKSQISAAVSKQSKPLESREVFESKCAKLSDELEGNPVPCPPFWGGYLVRPERIEFWQGRENRMHDRFEYRREGSSWKIQRLWP